ncbi:bifunctional glycosyltransferase family 2 protein/CDP-glycerol:glycerophosphate glycerophosphotransferase [Actinocorallia longicatena]|uniref:Glycosyltransferase 2-like domain-containing protein n=1 Tax=Actinocorallia longicatena TaxID=111803 RepID=A0ABP6QFT2_9ACTN
MSAPRLTVVVAFRDASDRLQDCLESIAAQTLSDLEAVMVDDGSIDGGEVVAKSFAERDPRFRLTERTGGTSARDLGARQARGEFLAFVDPDDLVPPRAFAALVEALETTGADVACGALMRKETGRTTLVAPEPPLDEHLATKLFRTGFWRRRALEFGPGGCGAAAVVRAQLLASAVTTVEAPVRVRDDVLRPVAAKYDAATLLKALAEARAVRDVLLEHRPGLVAEFRRRIAAGLLGDLIDAIPRTTAGDRGTLMIQGAEFLRGADVSGLPALARLRLHLLGARMPDELVEVAATDQAPIVGAPVFRRRTLTGVRWYARYPFYGTRKDLPRHLYDVTDELTLQARADELRWTGDLLTVTGRAHFGRVDVAAEDDLRIRLTLRDTKHGTRVPLPVRRVRRPEITAASGQQTACYDWAGFVTEIDFAALPYGRKGPRASEWEIEVEASAQGLRERRPLGCPTAPQARWIRSRDLESGVRIRPVSGGDRFVVKVGRPAAVVTGHRLSGDGIEIAGRARTEPGTGAGLTARTKDGRRFTVPLTPSGAFGFTAVLPLAGFTAEAGLGELWDFCLEADGRSHRLLLDEDVPEARYALGDGDELSLTRTLGGHCRARVGPARPIATGVRWDGPDLEISGRHLGPSGRQEEITVRHRQTGEECPVPLRWTGDRFSFRFRPGHTGSGLAGPLIPGTWRFLLDGTELGAERRVLADLPEARVAGFHEVEASGRTEALELRVRLALGPDERGRYAQRVLREREYPRSRAEPLLDLVVFDSFKGKQYSCNPRAVFEELRRQGGGLDCGWVSSQGQFTVPDGGRPILFGSRDHYEALARTRYVVSNEAQPPWYDKRPGQTYVQCWHGTPLKRLGLDVPMLPHKRQDVRSWIAQEVVRWDLLVSPNPFTTPIMRRAYQYDGPVIESGYPRNDVLSAPGREEIAARVRRRLGIPEGKKVVLYAPTWRDDQLVAPGRRAFELALDVEAAAKALGDDHVLLMRTHYLVTDRVWSRIEDFVLDVSRYPDIAELYLVADILVTDYSSVMFDFAITGKPMLFFTYDLEHYRDRVRGFYFDFEAEAPGPLCRDSAELFEAVRDLDAVTEAHAERYRAFREKFCPFDDGHAAERVIARLLELGNG